MSDTQAPKSCADYPGHIWRKNGAEPIQAGAPCVCGQEVWGAEDDEWPPDGYTNEAQRTGRGVAV